MTGTPPRYTTVANRAGVVVVDQTTGEITFVPTDGAGVRVLRPGRDEAQGDPSSMSEADTISRHYPLPIARSYAMVLAARDPTLRCLAIVECFVATLRYWTLCLAAEYVASDLRDELIDPLLCGQKGKLISEWEFLFNRLLMVLSAPPREPFFVGFRASVDALGKFTEPTEPRVRLPDDPAVLDKSERVPPIKALVNFRNRIAHDPLPRGERAADLASRFHTMLRRVLRETRCVAEHPLCARRANGTYLKLMGAVATELPEGARPSSMLVRDGVFLMRPGAERVLGADITLAIHDPSPSPEDVQLLLFENFDRDDAVYHSTSGEVVHRRLKSNPWSQRFEEHRSGLNLDRLDLARLTATLAPATEQRLARWKSEETWLPDQLIETNAMRTLAAFIRAPIEVGAQGEAGVLRLLCGARGSGRRTTLAWLAHTFCREYPVLLLSRTTLRSMHWEYATLRAMIPHARRDQKLTDVLAQIGKVLNTSRLILLYEDLDGSDGQSQLESLREAIASGEQFPWLRIVASCDTTRRNGPVVKLGGFNAAEIVEAYRGLQRRTREESGGLTTLVSAPTTPPEALRHLPIETRESLAHPRTLRLLAERYHGKPLPLAFLREAVGRVRVDALASRLSDASGVDLHHAVRAIIGAMLASHRAELSQEEIVGAVRRVFFSWKPESGAQHCLDVLRDEAIIVVEVRDAAERWRFRELTVFDALVVESQIQAVTDAPRLWQLALDWTESSGFGRALVALMVRLCETGRHDVWLDAIDRADGRECQPTLVASARCLTALAVGGFDGLGALLDALVQRPTRNDVAVVVDAASAALYTAPGHSLQALARALEALERALGVGALPPAAGLILVRMLLTVDRRSDASRRLEALRARSREFSEPLRREVLVESMAPTTREGADALVAQMNDGPRDAAWAAALRASANVEIDARRWPEARRRCELALECSDARERLRVRLLQQWIAYKSGDVNGSTSDALIRDAESLGHLDLLRMAYQQRAIEHDARGKFPDALAMAERSVEIGRVAGSSRRLASNLLNLGVFRIHAGDFHGARSWLREAAELALRESRPSIASDAMALIAVIERELEDHDAAKASIETALRYDCPPEERRAALWIDWCFDPTPERATRWREALPGDEHDRVEQAQMLGVALFEELARLPLEQLEPRFEEMGAELDRNPWRKEVFDLPLLVAHAVVERALGERDLDLAKRVVARCATWVDGRPWSAMSALEALVRDDVAAPLRTSMPAPFSSA